MKRSHGESTGGGKIKSASSRGRKRRPMVDGRWAGAMGSIPPIPTHGRWTGGIEKKPGRQSEDDRTPRGIIRISSVGLSGDSGALNNDTPENERCRDCDENGFQSFNHKEFPTPKLQSHGDLSVHKFVVTRLPYYQITRLPDYQD